MDWRGEEWSGVERRKGGVDRRTGKDGVEHGKEGKLRFGGFNKGADRNG